jgi:hypothetical protein
VTLVVPGGIAFRKERPKTPAVRESIDADA